MGGTAVLLADDSFRAEQLWDEVERHRVTRVLIVGDVFARPMLQALEAHPGRWDLTSLKVISSAGLMWSEEVKRGLVQQLPQLQHRLPPAGSVHPAAANRAVWGLTGPAAGFCG